MGASGMNRNTSNKNRTKEKYLSDKQTDISTIDRNKMDDEAFINKMLEKHSFLREKHGCKKNSLKLNKELCKKAQEYILKLIDKNQKFPYSGLYKDDILGENVLISNSKLDPEDVCHKWYEEKENYNYDSNKFQKGKGHFTQLVWKKTNEVGFGFVGDNNKYYYVALYYPKGNILNEFKENVLKEKEAENNLKS